MRPSIGMLADVGVPPPQLVELAREAEVAGFDGARMIEYEYDSLAIDQAIATSTSRITTGSTVSRYHTRHPLLTAQTATVVDHLAPGRFTIGIGSGPAKRTDPGVPQQRWGQAADRAVGRLREYLEVVRLALGGGTLSYDGEFYGFTGVQIRLTPASPHIPIWLAAGGEQTARLAGRLADGVLVQFADRDTTQRTLEQARSAAARAGRDPQALRLGNLVMTCVSEDADAARRAMRAHLVDWYLHQPRIQRLFAKAGYAAMADEIRRMDPPHDTRGSVPQILADPRARQAAAAIPDEFLDTFTIAGTPQECRDKLDQLSTWGTDVPILYPYPVDGDWAEGYRSVIGAFASTRVPR